MSSSRILLTGGAGVIGKILARDLIADYEVVVLDEQEGFVDEVGVHYVRGSVADPAHVGQAIAGCDYVIHLARAKPQDWDHLLEVDITGTRTVFMAAADGGLRRIIYASSNQVTAGYERDRLHGATPGLPEGDLFCRPRPINEYAVAKLYGEALARYIVETTETSVSCLRIGTVREVDNPERYAGVGGYEWIPGGPDAVLARLRASWLTHADLVTLVREEIAATGRFRLRYGVSDSPARYWPLSILEAP
jgi:NAD+ dependent glucose-6-phosphate dehydrogenase